MEYKIQEETLTAIADAIRQKASTQTQYTPVEMPGAIENIPTGMPMGGITILFYDGSTFGDAGPTIIIEEGSI